MPKCCFNKVAKQLSRTPLESCFCLLKTGVDCQDVIGSSHISLIRFDYFKLVQNESFFSAKDKPLKRRSFDQNEPTLFKLSNILSFY